MRRTVLASMTKFWPRCLVGRRSSSAARNGTPPARGVFEPAADMVVNLVATLSLVEEGGHARHETR